MHLGKVATDKERRESVIPELENLSFEDAGEDELSTNVYGSKFAAADLPKHEMPDREMPREIAYRMIK